MYKNIGEAVLEAAAIMRAMDTPEAMAFLSIHPKSEVVWHPWDNSVVMTHNEIEIAPYDEVVDVEGIFCGSLGCISTNSAESTVYDLGVISLKTVYSHNIFAAYPNDILDLLRRIGLLKTETREEEVLSCSH